jgi:hypothetical protein
MPCYGKSERVVVELHSNAEVVGDLAEVVFL